jgi:uracil-DNA glycosylase family 4
MDARRLAMLREMGIAVWTERGASPDGQADAAGPSAPAATAGSAAQAPAIARTPVPAREHGLPASARPSRRPSQEGATAVSPATDAEGAERAARIARLDWAGLKAGVSDCTACALHASRTRTVFGAGDENADWLLVGEAPGGDEDRLGEPFVGQAGKLLEQMLGAIGLARGHDVYIANVLKCRPPGNRNPQPGEVARCAPHLLRQIDLIRPRLILAMGRFAAQTLLGTDASIASLRGRLHSYHGVPLIVTYHPAYLLRTPEDKARSWHDLLFALETMAGLQSAAAAPT